MLRSLNKNSVLKISQRCVSKEVTHINSDMTRQVRDGFTLQELMVVIIILGVLSGIALPRFTFQIEKMRKAEGEQILYALYMSQLKYQKETGNYTTSIGNLDIDVRSPTYFNTPVVDDTVSLACSGSPGSAYASITRNDSSYTLHVIDDAVIRCTPCNGSVCQRLGYPTF